MERKVTFENVAAAATALTEAGQRPSVRAVITALGGGSPNSVLSHLQAWKAARPSVKAADVTIDPRIAEILAAQISASVIDATKAAEARAADLEADAEAVAEAGRAAEARVEELTADLERAQAENQQLMGRLTALTSEVEQSKREAAEAILEARQAAEREREAAESSRQALARAELRLEGLPALEAQLQELRNKLDAERDARAALDKRAAVAEAEAAGRKERISTLGSDLSRAQALVGALEEKLDAERAARLSAEKLAAAAEAERAARQAAPKPEQKPEQPSKK